jgi:hypothetical protein
VQTSRILVLIVLTLLLAFIVIRVGVLPVAPIITPFRPPSATATDNSDNNKPQAHRAEDGTKEN